jgi:hypothetical protein
MQLLLFCAHYIWYRETGCGTGVCDQQISENQHICTYMHTHRCISLGPCRLLQYKFMYMCVCINISLCNYPKNVFRMSTKFIFVFSVHISMKEHNWIKFSIHKSCSFQRLNRITLQNITNFRTSDILTLITEWKAIRQTSISINHAVFLLRVMKCMELGIWCVAHYIMKLKLGFANMGCSRPHTFLSKGLQGFDGGDNSVC